MESEYNNMIQHIFALALSAVIGCFTNYIALKMLFRPYEKKQLFGLPVPFTPGIIPMRRRDIAKAIGRLVSEDLMDDAAVEAALCEKQVIDSINTGLMQYTMQFDKENHALPSRIADGIADRISKSGLEQLVTQEVFQMLKARMDNSIAALLVKDQILMDIAATFGEKVQSYVENEGRIAISKKIEQEILELNHMPIVDILDKYEVDQMMVRTEIARCYTNTIHTQIAGVMEAVNIGKIVEEKVNAMEMQELERITFKVMRHELHAIIYLGAFIGFLLGLLHLLF